MKINPISEELLASTLSTTQTGQQINQDFGDLLQTAINQVNAIQKESSQLSTRFDMGDRDVSLSDVMIARNKSSVAFEATVQIRNRFIEAYKELMNMPV